MEEGQILGKMMHEMRMLQIYVSECPENTETG